MPAPSRARPRIAPRRNRRARRSCMSRPSYAASGDLIRVHKTSASGPISGDVSSLLSGGPSPSEPYLPTRRLSSRPDRGGIMHDRSIASGSDRPVESLETHDRDAPAVVGSVSQLTGRGSAMAVCPQCGAGVVAADASCAQCGSQVKQPSAPRSASSVPDPSLTDAAGSPGSSQPSSPSSSMTMPQWQQVTKRGWWLLGGLALVFIGSLLPWSEVDGASAGSPSGGGVVVFLFLVICTVVTAWPLLTGMLSKRRLLGRVGLAAGRGGSSRRSCSLRWQGAWRSRAGAVLRRGETDQRGFCGGGVLIWVQVVCSG